MQIKNENFTEKLIFKGLLESKRYNALVCNALDSKLFENENAVILFKELQQYFKTYKEIPTLDIIKNIVPEKQLIDIIKYIDEVNSIDINVSQNMEFIVNETDEWLRESALTNAILDSADLISSGKRNEYEKINQLVKNALTKTLKFDIGTNYFEDLGTRLQRMFDMTKNKISTGYLSLDEIMAGGMPSSTLTVFFGRTHGNKSGMMANMITRQVLAGKIVVMFTLEMSEDMTAQRIDAILSGYDINRIYIDRKKELVTELSKIKQKEGLGTLIIKEFPSGAASTNNFRTHLYELELRGIKPDVVYADYIGLMKTEAFNSRDGLYESRKAGYSRT